MSWEAVGWILVGVGAATFIYGYHLASVRLDEAEHWLEHRREIDRTVPVWSRGTVYDWAERGDL